MTTESAAIHSVRDVVAAARRGDLIMFSNGSNPAQRVANARAATFIDNAATLGAVDRGGLAPLAPRIHELVGATAYVRVC
jgi:hypothetical protein